MPYFNNGGGGGGGGGIGPPGPKGQDGITPHIGENGHWFIGSTDTGVAARGESAVISDEPPENPTDGMLWRRPVGSLSLAAELSGIEGVVALQPVMLSDIHVSDTPPEDTSKMWYRPVEA